MEIVIALARLAMWWLNDPPSLRHIDTQLRPILCSESCTAIPLILPRDSGLHFVHSPESPFQNVLSGANARSSQGSEACVHTYAHVVILP